MKRKERDYGTKLGEPHLEVLVIPPDARLGVGWLLHAVDEAQVVEEGDELGRLDVPKTIAPWVLDERKQGL